MNFLCTIFKNKLLSYIKKYNCYKRKGKKEREEIHRFVFYMIHLYTKYYRKNNTIQEIANAND